MKAIESYGKGTVEVYKRSVSKVANINEFPVSFSSKNAKYYLTKRKSAKKSPDSPIKHIS